VGLTLENPFPQDIAGTFTLTFQGSNGAEDPNVQFLSSAGGSRSMTFTVPAGSKTLPNPPSIATGTVAGTITITTNLTANGTALDPAPPPQTIVIPPAPPVITSVTFSNTNGLTVTVIGYSTTRDMTSGDFVFSAAPGSSLQNSDIPVQLGPAFTQWYAASASNPFGSQFKLTVPFNVTTGSASSVTSVSVSLTNSQGKSAPVSAQ
ncbi:MAG TPA: hypothetical protein VFW83_00840, partial [Bryobacteraceae bacterium]|nr:hypothetical protein [Bryobacteraceae bacterium]